MKNSMIYGTIRTKANGISNYGGDQEKFFVKESNTSMQTISSLKVMSLLRSMQREKNTSKYYLLSAQIV